jgi:hypothetical protein
MVGVCDFTVMENIARAMVMCCGHDCQIKKRDHTEKHTQTKKHDPGPGGRVSCPWSLATWVEHVPIIWSLPIPPFENLKGAFENIPDASGILDRLMQLILLILMGKAFNAACAGHLSNIAMIKSIVPIEKSAGLTTNKRPICCGNVSTYCF